MLEPNILSVERLLFRSDVACIGEFRCSPDNPLFPDSGPPRCHVVGFYRSALWIAIEEQEAFVADPNVVTFHNAGQPYRRRKISKAGDHCDWFALAPDVMRELIGRRDAGVHDRVGPFTITCKRVSANLFLAQRRLVHRLRAIPARDPLYVEEEIVGIYERLIAEAYPIDASSNGPGRPRESAHRREIVEQVRAILAARFREHHSLRSLATAVGCSVFHLCRIFHGLTGTPLRRYLTDLRLRNAVDQLSSGAGDLSTLALDLGFSSHSHFTSAFRTTFGHPPSTIRGWPGRPSPV